MLAFSAIGFSQSITLKGIVSSPDGTPLIGVTVQIAHTSKGAITDNQGNFLLQSSTHKGTLIFTFLGMKTVTRSFEGTSSFKIVMEEYMLLL